MKNKKSQGLTFQKKSITELQHNDSVSIRGGVDYGQLIECINKVINAGITNK